MKRASKTMATKTTATKTLAKSPKELKKSERDIHVKMSDHMPSADNAAVEGGRYVYGIVQSKDLLTFGRNGIGGTGEMVYTVTYQDTAAVVSNTSVYIFDPTRENALAHEHVIEMVMKNHTIIPMSFGTVFRTDEDRKSVV